MPRWVNWLVPLAALASYAVLVLHFGPRLEAEAGGLLPFDLRPLGYDSDAVRAYLAALTPEGAALYLGPIRANDTLVPLLFTLTLLLPLRGWGWLWFLPALAYGFADLAENVAVASLITQGAGVPDGVIAAASALTMAKFAAVTLALLVAALALWGKWRMR